MVEAATSQAMIERGYRDARRPTPAPNRIELVAAEWKRGQQSGERKPPMLLEVTTFGESEPSFIEVPDPGEVLRV